MGIPGLAKIIQSGYAPTQSRERGEEQIESIIAHLLLES